MSGEGHRQYVSANLTVMVGAKILTGDQLFDW